jgi:cytochrome c peroxidase
MEKSNLTKGLLFLCFGLFLLQSCQKDDDEVKDVAVVYDGTPYQIKTGKFEQPVISSDNKLTIQGVKLGRMLFYEKKLSGNQTISCADCHRQEHAFTDTARFSEGIRNLRGKRNAMAVFNMAWNNNEFFWDGRAHLLRHQSLLPIQDPLEMDESLPNVVNKLKGDEVYRQQFTRAFGNDEINPEKISLALEQFMNSIVSVNSKYDKYKNGTAQLDSVEERGRYLFFAEFNPGFPNLSGADCAHCHTTLNFENDKYLNNALDSDADMTDDGRMKVTNDPNDKGKFKVTSLRNIELTAPYMHDGRFKTLEEVVEHYNSGMKNSSTIDPALIYPLNSGGLQLSADDKKALIAFLKTLTDDDLMTNTAYSNPF